MRYLIPALLLSILLTACGQTDYNANFDEGVDPENEDEQAVGFYDPTANMPGKMTKAMRKRLAGMQTDQGQINLLEFLRTNGTIMELNILGKGLDDETVRINNLRPWIGGGKSYAGQYDGPYSSVISRVELTGDGQQFNGSITVQEEVVKESGMMEPETEQAKLKKVALSGSLISWAKPMAELNVESGQFVSWEQDDKQQHGLLVYDQAADINAFTLLTKVKRQ